MDIVNITGVRGRGNAVMGRGRGIAIASNNLLVRNAGIGRGHGRGRGRGRGQVVADDFVQATSSNLPTVSCFTVADYYQSLLSPELRQAKDQISANKIMIGSTKRAIIRSIKLTITRTYLQMRNNGLL